MFERSHLLVQLLFTRLLAGWSIWAGIAISARSADVRAPPDAVSGILGHNTRETSPASARG